MKLETIKWIPVEIDLPPLEGEEYLVTVKSIDDINGLPTVSYVVDIATFSKHMYSFGGNDIMIPCYDHMGFSCYNDWSEGQPCWITAWAEIPKAYGEE